MPVRQLKSYTTQTGYVYQYYFVGKRQALAAWSASHGRDLSEPEQYAAVELQLMQRFDEIVDMLHEGRRFRLEGESLASLLESIWVAE